jgi:hypothetical protein
MSSVPVNIPPVDVTGISRNGLVWATVLPGSMSNAPRRARVSANEVKRAFIVFFLSVKR